jgi:hypothetical protein
MSSSEGQRSIRAPLRLARGAASWISKTKSDRSSPHERGESSPRRGAFRCWERAAQALAARPGRGRAEGGRTEFEPAGTATLDVCVPSAEPPRRAGHAAAMQLPLRVSACRVMLICARTATDDCGRAGRAAASTLAALRCSAYTNGIQMAVPHAQRFGPRCATIQLPSQESLP